MPKIDSFRFGQITIDGKGYTSDVVIFPNRVNSSWWRKEGHELNPEDIKEILEEKPELLIVGTGTSGLMKVKEETRKILEEKGIRLIERRTPEACKLYNESKGKVVAALHLTC